MLKLLSFTLWMTKANLSKAKKDEGGTIRWSTVPEKVVKHDDDVVGKEF